MTGILTEIEEFIALHNMTASAFGRLAMNDKHYVPDLRRGKNSFPETKVKIRKFMANFDASCLVRKARPLPWKEQFQIDECDRYILRDHRIEAVRVRGNIVALRARSRKTGKATSLAKMIMNPPDGMVVDHINGNPLNNRRVNLRVCTHKQNAANRRVTSSGYKGVECRRGKFHVAICYNYKNKHIGVFPDAVSAAKAYDAAAREVFGEFAALNFPTEGEQTCLRTGVVG